MSHCREGVDSKCTYSHGCRERKRHTLLLQLNSHPSFQSSNSSNNYVVSQCQTFTEGNKVGGNFWTSHYSCVPHVMEKVFCRCGQIIYLPQGGSIYTVNNTPCHYLTSVNTVTTMRFTSSSIIKALNTTVKSRKKETCKKNALFYVLDISVWNLHIHVFMVRDTDLNVSTLLHYNLDP